MRQSFWRAMAGSLILTLGSASSGIAHEFWLVPDNFAPPAGAQLTVDLRNGEMMSGVSLPYLPGSVTRFDMVAQDAVVPVVSRLGDMPAMSMAAPAEGLVIVVYESSDNTITYDGMARFEQFITHKATATVLDAHAARGLPDSGFTETYRRYAKTLIGVGHGAGQDRATGLRIEIVALANPYTDDLTAGMPLQALLDGAPRAGARIGLFASAPDGTVTETFHTADATGRVVVPIQKGFSYLADTVEVYALPNDDAGAGPVWHSDWASLTYLVP